MTKDKGNTSPQILSLQVGETQKYDPSYGTLQGTQLSWLFLPHLASLPPSPFILGNNLLTRHPGPALLMKLVLRTASAPRGETEGHRGPRPAPLVSAFLWGDLLLTPPPWGKIQARQLPVHSQ